MQKRKDAKNIPQRTATYRSLQRGLVRGVKNWGSPTPFRVGTGVSFARACRITRVWTPSPNGWNFSPPFARSWIKLNVGKPCRTRKSNGNARDGLRRS